MVLYPRPILERAVKQLRILVIDDDEANLYLLQQCLEGKGYTSITTTADSRCSAQLFREVQPDLVLLDLRMPAPDGFAVMAELRGSLPGDVYLPIVVLTADASTGTRLRALASGATDFLTKPLELAEVDLRVRSLLETRLLHLQLSEQKQSLEKKVRERTSRIRDMLHATIERLALIAEFRDDETYQHTVRVGKSSELIATQLGLGREFAETMRRAAPLHDIGKIGVPDRILLKPAPLTDEEFEEMKAHTTIGARILGGTSSRTLGLAEQIALNHHERWDGTGYRGLAGTAIPLAARIVSVADVYDALINVRPYKSAWPVERALGEMQAQRGRQFDPDILDAFLQVVGRAGSVPLSTGRVA